MSAEIISFPLKTASCIEQQRWIPAPPPRRTPGLRFVSYLHIFGILIVAMATWVLLAGSLRRVTSILQG